MNKLQISGMGFCFIFILVTLYEPTKLAFLYLKGKLTPKPKKFKYFHKNCILIKTDGKNTFRFFKEPCFSEEEISTGWQKWHISYMGYNPIKQKDARKLFPRAFRKNP